MAAIDAPAPQRRLLAPPYLGGVLGALVFWFMSLWPTLLPRSAGVQAAVSALAAAIGWMLGSGAQWAAARLAPRPAPDTARERAWRTVIAAGVIAVPSGLYLWWLWQNEHRRLLGLYEISGQEVVPLAVITLAVAATLVLVGRLILAGVRRVDRGVARLLPNRWARAVTSLIVVIVVVGIYTTGQRRFLGWADQQFGYLDTSTDEGIDRPTSAAASGSTASAIPWETLGRQGRNFVAGAAKVEDLAAFHGRDVLEPIRIYAGLDSAPTPAERAELVVAELERTGALEREVLVIVTATGTGWVNPVAAEAVEYLHRGDTAIVSQQYSFFPSWIAFLVDPALSPDTGQVLFDAVWTRWAKLPADSRPRLLTYGESLGSYGSEANFAGDGIDASLAAMTGSTHGSLFIGPKSSNPIFQQLIAARDDGSPAWRPTLDRQPGLRLENRAADIDPFDPSWDSPRILYMFHPTDGVGTWDLSHIWSRPEWTRSPTGFGVPERVTWFPIVTWIQESADLMAGFSADTGFGHDYADAFVEAWSALSPPEGWTADDVERLDEHLSGLSDG